MTTTFLNDLDLPYKILLSQRILHYNHSSKSLEEDVQELEECIDNIPHRNTVLV